MNESEPWSLKVRVISPDSSELSFTEMPVSREQWRIIRERARQEGIPIDQWISRELLRELKGLLASARASFSPRPHMAGDSTKENETTPDT